MYISSSARAAFLSIIPWLCAVLSAWPPGAVAFTFHRGGGSRISPIAAVHHPRRSTFTLTKLHDATAADKEPSSSDNEKEPLTPDKIGEMIEVSFVNGVMQLSQGYIDVLKLFIVASKAGYEQGMAMSDLVAEVEACPVQSANRPLMDEEIGLRQSWMNIVYLVLQNIGHGTDDVEVGKTVDKSARDKFGSLVQTIASEMKADEAKAASITLDDAVATGKSNGLDFSDLGLDDPMDKAIAMQCMRVIKVVFTVLEEERRCFEEGGAGPAPRPPIPGAFKGTN